MSVWSRNVRDVRATESVILHANCPPVNPPTQLLRVTIRFHGHEANAVNNTKETIASAHHFLDNVIAHDLNLASGQLRRAAVLACRTELGEDKCDLTTYENLMARKLTLLYKAKVKEIWKRTIEYTMMELGCKEIESLFEEGLLNLAKETMQRRVEVYKVELAKLAFFTAPSDWEVYRTWE